MELPNRVLRIRDIFQYILADQAIGLAIRQRNLVSSHEPRGDTVSHAGFRDPLVGDGQEVCVDVDTNHPYAGKPLQFDVEVLNVRDATADEISHGHVHGEGGVHH